jgi:hypothetical protein
MDIKPVNVLVNSVTGKVWLMGFGNRRTLWWAIHYHQGPAFSLNPGVAQRVQWQIEELNGAPIAQFGIEVSSEGAADGRLYVDYIDWSGTPSTVFRRPDGDGKMWLRAWINAVDHVGTRWGRDVSRGSVHLELVATVSFQSRSERHHGHRFAEWN